MSHTKKVEQNNIHEKKFNIFRDVTFKYKTDEPDTPRYNQLKGIEIVLAEGYSDKAEQFYKSIELAGLRCQKRYLKSDPSIKVGWSFFKIKKLELLPVEEIKNKFSARCFVVAGKNEHIVFITRMLEVLAQEFGLPETSFSAYEDKGIIKQQ